MERIEFVASGTSPAALLRKVIWGGALLGIVLSVVRHGAGGAALFSGAISVLLVGAIDWFVLRRYGKGRLVAVLDGEGIESPLFVGKVKRFVWNDVHDVVLRGQGGRIAELRLVPGPGRPDKRLFFSGRNPCRPQLPLGALDAQDQERLLRLLLERVGNMAPGIGAQRLATLHEELAFSTRLKALPRPWVTYVLVAVNVAVWAVTVALGGWGRVDSARLLDWGGNASFQVQQGEWWRLLSATFLHSGEMHLAMNMIGVLAVGPLLERLLGRARFLLVYLGAALVGSAASLHFGAHSAVSVGASGAVFGVAGALLATVFRHRAHVPKSFGKQTLVGFGAFVLYSLLQGFAQPHVDNAAHVGGLLAGAALAWLLPVQLGPALAAHSARRRDLAALALVLVAVTALAWSAPRTTVDQRQVFASLQAMQSGFRHLAQASTAVQKDQEAVKAGRMTVLEADERSRTVHAPVFRGILVELDAVRLPASHPAAPLAADGRRMAQLLHEILAMESDVVDGKPVPARPERAREIDREVLQLKGRIEQHLARLNRKR